MSFDSATGAFTYTPDANYNGTDSFVFTANDGKATSDPATVALTVNSVNDAPVASGQTRTTDEDTPLDGTLTATDVDGDTLTFIVTQPTHGTLTLNSDTGDFTYTPAANYNGTDVFTFKANDGTTDSKSATVLLTVNPVNDAPVAVADTYSATEDTELSVAAPGVLTNDLDVDGDLLTAAVMSGPSHGDLTLNADGSFTYTPDANYNGTDRFTYTASDGKATSDPATVTINVAAVNDAPVAAEQALTTDEDTPLNGSVSATDVDGDTLTYAVTSGPSHGTLKLNTDGSFTYTPAADYNGPDSFTFTASDGTATSDPATVSLTVNPVNNAPVASGQTLATDEDTPLDGSVSATDVDGDPLTFAVTSQPSHGSLEFNPATGAFTYTPEANYNGTDSFAFTASDGKATSDPATVALTVNSVNDAPVAAGQTLTTDEDTPLDGTLTATDVDGDTLTYAVTSGPSHGTLKLNTDWLVHLHASSRLQRPDNFTFTADDGTATSDPATVTINVAAVNDAPVASDQSLTTNEDTPLTDSVSATDVDGDTLTFVVTVDPTHGTLTFDPNTGSFRYTPAADYNGADSFVFSVSDGKATSDPATVALTVNPVNDAPVASGQTLATE